MRLQRHVWMEKRRVETCTLGYGVRTRFPSCLIFFRFTRIVCLLLCRGSLSRYLFVHLLSRAVIPIGCTRQCSREDRCRLVTIAASGAALDTPVALTFQLSPRCLLRLHQQQ